MPALTVGNSTENKIIPWLFSRQTFHAHFKNILKNVIRIQNLKYKLPGLNKIQINKEYWVVVFVCKIYGLYLSYIIVCV